MATINCSYGGFAYYNGGYTPENGYMTDSSGGYIGDGDGYGYVAKLVIPSAAGAAAGRSLTITLGLMTLYYSDITLEYWITTEGRPAGVNYGSGPPPIKGTQLLHGTVAISGLGGSNWSYKTFTTGATSSLPAGGGTYYLWLRSNRNAVAGGGSTPTIKLNYTAITSCTPPTSLSISPALFEGNVTLSWSGAVAGVSNPIAGYDFYCRDSNNGSSWGAWGYCGGIQTSAGSGSWTTTPAIARGTYRQYRIYTIASAGSGYHSSPADFSAVKKNSVPATPSSLSVSAAIILSGTNVTVSWPAASDPDGNFARYRIERTVNGGSSWDLVTTTTTTNTSQPVNVNAGTKVQYRVRSEDALGAVSGYAYSGYVTINTAPSAPTSLSVSAAKYTQGDPLTLSWPSASDPDNNLAGYVIQYCVTVGGVWGSWSSLAAIGKVTSYKTTPSQAADGAKIKYRIQAKDSLGLTSGFVSSAEVLRDDYTGIHFYDGGSEKKGYPYLCTDGSSFKKCEIWLCGDGANFVKGVD